MKVEFDNTHLVAYGKDFENCANQYSYGFIREEHPLSQLQICLTGDPKFILDKLKKVIIEMEHDLKEGQEPNKPSQGVIVHHKAYVSEVITPVWNNKIDPETIIPANPINELTKIY